MKEKAGAFGNFLVGLIIALVMLAIVDTAQHKHDTMPFGNLGGITQTHHHHH